METPPPPPLIAVLQGVGGFWLRCLEWIAALAIIMKVTESSDGLGVNALFAVTAFFFLSHIACGIWRVDQSVKRAVRGTSFWPAVAMSAATKIQSGVGIEESASFQRFEVNFVLFCFIAPMAYCVIGGAVIVAWTARERLRERKAASESRQNDKTS
jgi:hypothetical protein